MSDVVEGLKGCVFFIWQLFTSLEITALERLTNNQKLLINLQGEQDIKKLITDLDLLIKHSKSRLSAVNYSLYTQFYDALKNFYDSLELKGIFTKYYAYKFSSLNTCVSKLNSIFGKLNDWE